MPLRRLVPATAALALSILSANGAAAQDVAPLGSNLERFAYPWPEKRFAVRVGDEDAQMTFMDVAPKQPNGQSVVLLHGKNFCAATWESTARALLAAGYRVIVPDQLGFCKSSKPASAQYTLALMADATHRLLEAQGVEKPIMLAHSTGGMLALRYALMFPDDTSRLLLINPLGLVDRMEQGVPYVPLDKLIAAERAKDRASIKGYQLRTYYHGEWRADYDRWVDMLAGQYATEDDDKVEIAQAKTAEMILTQPVSHEFGNLKVPVTLMIGRLDTTTFGKGQAPDAVKVRLRPIPEVVEDAAARMPDARIVWFEGRGHSPQVEAPDEFEPRLIQALESPAP